MRSKCVRIPIKATAHVPIDRPDTYQRLPTARPHLRTAAGPYIRVESGLLGALDRAGLLMLPPLGPGHHHVDGNPDTVPSVDPAPLDQPVHLCQALRPRPLHVA